MNSDLSAGNSGIFPAGEGNGSPRSRCNYLQLCLLIDLYFEC
jgi:hypothetical protein